MLQYPFVVPHESVSETQTNIKVLIDVIPTLDVSRDIFRITGLINRRRFDLSPSYDFCGGSRVTIASTAYHGDNPPAVWHTVLAKESLGSA